MSSALQPHTVAGTRTAPREHATGLRILIVDDEPILRQMLTYMLRRDDVVTASDGASALEILAHDAEFDVILTDLSMPGVGGLALHALVAERHPALAPRMIFCSGNPKDPALLAFLGSVPNLMVAKPYQGSAIAAAIEATLARAGAG